MGNQMNAPAGGGNQRNIIIAVVVAVVLICCCCLTLGLLYAYGDALMAAMGLASLRPLSALLMS
jgi:hypothetical protein